MRALVRAAQTKHALRRLRTLDLSDNVLGPRNADGGATDPGAAALADAVGSGALPSLCSLRLNASRVGDHGASPAKKKVMGCH